MYNSYKLLKLMAIIINHFQSLFCNILLAIGFLPNVNSACSDLFNSNKHSLAEDSQDLLSYFPPLMWHVKPSPI